MAAQLTYGFSTPSGVPGGKFDLADDNVVSRKNDEENGVMHFGMAVAQGATAGKTVKVPVAGTTADKIDGVVVAREHTEQDMAGAVVVQKGATVSVMTKGNIWGRLADAKAPTYGAKAYVLVSGTNAGCFTATAADATTVDIGATFGNSYDLTNGIAEIVLA